MGTINISKEDIGELQKVYEKMLEHDMGTEAYKKGKQALKEFEEHLGRKYGFIPAKVRGVRNLNGEVIPKDSDYTGFQCPHCHKVFKEKGEFEKCMEADATPELADPAAPEKK